MGTGRDHRSGSGGTGRGATGACSAAPGKLTLVGAAPAAVQMRSDAAARGDEAGAVHAAAAHGISGSSAALPFRDTIQRAFGRHDVSGIEAHTDAAAATGSRAMGAEAFATGNHVAFGGAPSLHTAAHEAAHVIQQRAGVHLRGGVGESGDAHERHADAVADRVVAGQSAQDLLDPYGAGGPGVQRSAVQRRDPPQPPAPAPGPLDPLRAAVAAGSAADAGAAYRALAVDARVLLAHDARLVTDLVRVLDPGAALAALTDLALPRHTLLQVASGGKPDDPAFLGDVLRLAALGDLMALADGAADVRQFPAFARRAVLDPIVNAAGATAMAQFQLASTAGGQALLQAVYPGQIPIEFLTRLHADLAVVRGGFTASASFRRWLLSKSAALNLEIVKTTEGFAWARAVWSSPDAAELAGWIRAYTAYWGQAIGDGLLSGATAADGAALRGHPAVAAAVFGAIAKVHTVAGLVRVFAGIHYALVEQIKALHDAGLLDAAALQLVLNATGVTVADQAAVTRDGAAIAMIQPLVAGQRADQVLTVLAGDPVAFCRAVAARNSFTTWVTHDTAQLTQTMNALPNWGAWIDALRTLDAWELLLKLAGDAGLRPNLRTGLIAKTAWNWLVHAVPHPVPTQAQASAILELYADGASISLPDKYLTWTALYRTQLSRAGHDRTDTWHSGFLWNTKWEKKYYAVDPDDDAMNMFFHSYRALPRAHVDAARGVMMNAVYTLKSDPLIGGATYWNDQGGAWTKVPSPGHVPQSTSWYMGDNWIIMQATGTAGAVGAVGSRGTPNSQRIGTFGGAPEAVNTPGTDPLSPTIVKDMTMFQNHATHEVGHAVGARKLKHGSYNTSGDDWTKTYGNWAEDGSANGYATMCGWTAAMDATNYTLNDSTGKTTTIAGAKIKAFLTGIVAGDVSSQSGHALARTFGSAAVALLVISGDATLGSHLLVQNVVQLATRGVGLPDGAYILPAGIAAGQSKVHFYATRWGNQWVTYDAVCWHSKVSHYGVSSYKEMFAEMYVAKFSGAAMPPRNNGMNPADFFGALEHADPKELGLPAYGGSKGTPGQAGGQSGGQSGGQPAGQAQGQGAGAAPAPGAAQPQGDPAADMPASARGTPL